jgi:putative RecB family exonuclease
LDKPGDVRAYISPSRLNLWLKCPLAFKLRYIDGVRAPPSPAMFVGKVVHATLECFYRHRQLDMAISASELLQRLLDSWPLFAAAEDVVFESVEQEMTCLRQATNLVGAYLQAIPPAEPKPLAVEVMARAPLIDPMTGEELGLPLLGVLDLVLDQAAGPVICDFKTVARNSVPLEITHEVQLGCYAYLFRQTSPVAEAGLEIRNLVKTKLPQIRFHPYPARGEQHFRRLFAVIRAYLDALDRRQFVFRPGFLCAGCEFLEKECRGWSG